MTDLTKYIALVKHARELSDIIESLKFNSFFYGNCDESMQDELERLQSVSIDTVRALCEAVERLSKALEECGKQRDGYRGNWRLWAGGLEYSNDDERCCDQELEAILKGENK